MRAVLFDLDGTLIDTAPDFVRILKELCVQDKLVPPSDDTIHAQVSAGARAMVCTVLGDRSEDDPDFVAFKERFLASYGDSICVDSRLFDGLGACLADLESLGVAWGIVTNKPKALTQKLLQTLSLEQRCHVLVCPEDVQVTKPDPEGLLLACRTLGVNPCACLYVGDHPRDIVAGLAAKMTTIAAAYGYVGDNDLQKWGAHAIAQSPAQLVLLIKRWLKDETIF